MATELGAAGISALGALLGGLSAPRIEDPEGLPTAHNAVMGSLIGHNPESGLGGLAGEAIDVTRAARDAPLEIPAYDIDYESTQVPIAGIPTQTGLIPGMIEPFNQARSIEMPWAQLTEGDGRTPHTPRDEFEREDLDRGRGLGRETGDDGRPGHPFSDDLGNVNGKSAALPAPTAQQYDPGEVEQLQKSIARTVSDLMLRHQYENARRV